MITLTPLITEKSYALSVRDISPAFTFIVLPEHSAEQIKKMIEQQYEVKVTDIRMRNLPRKVRRFKGIVGQTAKRARAEVRLMAGQRIAAFDLKEEAQAE